MPGIAELVPEESPELDRGRLAVLTAGLRDDVAGRLTGETGSCGAAASR